MSRELKYLNALNSIPHIGAANLRALKIYFGSYEAAWRAPESGLREAGVGRDALQAILWKRPSLNPDREMEFLVRENIWTITEDDEFFPALLKEIPASPVILYVRGGAELFRPKIAEQGVCFAVVGTRRPTHYGLEATESIVTGLAAAGLTIVSGLAVGIDARSHETALEIKGATIAVLGSGVDSNSIFPPENRGLARRIAESGGAVISEYAPETPAVKEHFPARNRIVAGLSRGVLIVEAREKSGALITARLALEQNRDVFAIPGSIFSSTSWGPHKLIQEGAKLVTSAEDILEELGMEYNYNKVSAQTDGTLEEREKILLRLLEEPLSIDVIKEKTGWETSAIVASLSMLELKERIRGLGGDTYQKIN